jgi:hypothetical protein
MDASKAHSCKDGKLNASAITNVNVKHVNVEMEMMIIQD